MSADPKESSAPLAEISNAPGAFEAFLDRNQKGVVVAGVLIALGMIGWVVQRGMEKSRQEEAGAALVKAGDLAAFQAVVDSHAGTNAAASAKLLLANSLWADGKKDEAVGALQKFISENADHAALPAAKASLGAKLMALGKSGDATKVFDELISDPAAAYIAPYALISLGDMAQAAGDLAKAEESYKKVSNDFPDSNFSQTATQRISGLKAKAPAEIEPPPAPPTPPTSATDQQTLDALKAALPAGLNITPGADPATPPVSVPAPAPAPESPPTPEP